MSEKFTGFRNSSPDGEVLMLGEVAEASTLLRVIAEDRPGRDYSVKGAIGHAAKRVSEFLPRGRRLSFHRTEDLWRQEAKAVRSWEMDAIRRAAAERDRDAAETRTATAALRALHQAYAATDPEFYCAQMQAIERVLGGAGGVAAPLGEGDSAVAVPEEGRR